MKVNANTLRAGNVIEYNNKLYVVVSNQLMSPGKGAAVAQVEMRDVRTGAKDNVRFRTQEQIERVRLDQNEYQYLYTDGDDVHLMHKTNFDQITVSKGAMGRQAAYLQEGMSVEVETFEGEALNFRLPVSVIMEIVEAEPVVKGQTATTSYKPAILENGEKVMVPPHIGSGTRIVVRIEHGTYIERARD